MVLEQDHPEAGRGQQKTVAAQAGGRIDEQWFVARAAEASRLHHQFAVRLTLSLAGRGPVEVDPQHPGQLGVVRTAQGQPLRPEHEQQVGLMRVVDQRYGERFG